MARFDGILDCTKEAHTGYLALAMPNHSSFGEPGDRREVTLSLKLPILWKIYAKARPLRRAGMRKGKLETRRQKLEMGGEIV